MRRSSTPALGLAVMLCMTCGLVRAQTVDAIYHGGTIITMSDESPTVEAVGTKDALLEHKGKTTKVIDLGGRAMLPGFFDSHGHAYMIGLQASVANLLPAPDGDVNSIDKLVETLMVWADQNKAKTDRVGWIIGFGYDNAQLEEQRHPTRNDLDKVSTEMPVVIIHQSGHVGSANSKALELAGITAKTKDPDGGRFGRDDAGEPTGYAEEYAFFVLVGAMGKRFDDGVNDVLVEEGAKLLATFGYTTGQEGRAVAPAIAAMKRVADAGKLPIDLVVYPDILAVDDIEPSMTYTNRLRIGGVKLTIDGSPQGKTAWLTKPYHVPPPGQKADYAGYGAITPEQTRDAIEKAYANGWQILTHANGDKASDIFIEAIRLAKQKHPDVDNRPVLIHGQVLRKDQVAAIDALGIFPSLFPMHTFYWGDYHLESVLGPERAPDISPTGWVRERGMMFGTHYDAPVALPDSMRILSATVTRRTRTNKVLGAQHCVDVMTALKAMTIWPAWQHFEEKTKGSIEVGKVADLVILSANPLTIEQSKLVDLKVMETIKGGQTVYVRDAHADARLLPAPLGLHGTPLAVNPTSPLLRAQQRHGIGADGCFPSAIGVLMHVLTCKHDSIPGQSFERLLIEGDSP